jgi:hypothetical protein
LYDSSLFPVSTDDKQAKAQNGIVVYWFRLVGHTVYHNSARNGDGGNQRKTGGRPMNGSDGLHALYRFKRYQLVERAISL